MTEALPAYPWMQPLLLAVLAAVGLWLRRRGATAQAARVGMAVLWLAVAIAVAWFAWSLIQTLALIRAG